MIQTCYTTSSQDADWIFIDCQVDEAQWDWFLTAQYDPVQIQTGIDQGWIVLGQG